MLFVFLKLAGLFQCTRRRRATGSGHEEHGKGAGVDQWAEHWEILDGLCKRRLQCL